MKPILVHLHIYYPHLYEELRECVSNISPYKFDLFVTMVEEHSDIISDIKATFPNAKIEIVENRGYDVGPFIHVLNQVNLDDFSYVVKLHTKRDMPTGALLNYFDISGDKWRNYALDFISNTDKFRYCINAFENNNNLGMISNYRLICNKNIDDQNENKEVMQLLNKLDYRNSVYGFVAGTIFMVKAELLCPLKKLQLNMKDFEIPDKRHSTTLAHTIERLLGSLVLAQNYKIEDVLSDKKYSKRIYSFFRMLKIFFFRKKISSDGVLRIKICKIQIYRKVLINKRNDVKNTI